MGKKYQIALDWDKYEWWKSKDSEFRLFFKKIVGREKMYEVQL